MKAKKYKKYVVCISYTLFYKNITIQMATEYIYCIVYNDTFFNFLKMKFSII